MLESGKIQPHDAGTLSTPYSHAATSSTHPNRTLSSRIVQSHIAEAYQSRITCGICGHTSRVLEADFASRCDTLLPGTQFLNSCSVYMHRGHVCSPDPHVDRICCCNLCRFKGTSLLFGRKYSSCYKTRNCRSRSLLRLKIVAKLLIKS